MTTDIAIVEETFKQYLPVLKNATIPMGGIKMVNGYSKTRIAFMKMKTLLWAPDGQPALSIIYGEDLTHLLKSSHYWLRFETPYKTLAFVNQKGKKGLMI